MTNKKAIKWLKLELEKGVSWDDTSESTKNIREQAEVEIKEAFDMAIKALEQEPCDAVSRQAVLDKLNRLIEVERLQGTDEMGYGRERVSAYESMIYEIKSEYLYPSVTPKEKTGHWLDQADEIDAQFERHEYKCSECGRIANYYVGGYESWWDIYKPNYCPNCGARMVSE